MSGRFLWRGVPDSPLVRGVSLKIHWFHWEAQIHQKTHMHHWYTQKKWCPSKHNLIPFNTVIPCLLSSALFCIYPFFSFFYVFSPLLSSFSFLRLFSLAFFFCPLLPFFFLHLLLHSLLFFIFLFILCPLFPFSFFLLFSSLSLLYYLPSLLLVRLFLLL